MSLKERLKEAAIEGLAELGESRAYEQALRRLASSPTEAAALIIGRLPQKVKEALTNGKQEIELGYVGVRADTTRRYQDNPLTDDGVLKPGSTMRLVCDALVEAGATLRCEPYPADCVPGITEEGGYNVYLASVAALAVL